MQVKKIIVTILLGGLLAFFSCSRHSVPEGINFSLKLSPAELSDFTYLKLDYQIQLSGEFKGFEKDYMVFIHFWRIKTKTMLLQDDHKPSTATSKWQAGDQFTYSRKLFIPKFIDEMDIDFAGYEDIRLTVGLYWPTRGGEKFTLYEEALRFQPSSYLSPGLVYSEGWNGLESNLKARDPLRRKWRWTKKKAICLIENTRKKSTLIIKGAVNKNVLAEQEVTLSINGRVIDKFSPAKTTFSRTFTLSPEQLGEEDEFTLSFETDKTFTPSKINPQSKDNRELGVQIYFLYFRASVD